jgi:serine/threonine protein kinase
LVSTAYTMAFVLGHWAVLRLRHSERAVKILREALYGGAAGKVGRHSGRLLRDTYQVGPLLAAGGMGEVYRGFHRRTGRAVAIKMLHPHLVDDPDVLQRFQREAEIAGKLGSPHIVQVIDIDQEENQPFLVLELLEGEDLAARLDRGPLPPAVVAEIVAQVASGVHQARQAGVVHRDLKPENIFLVAPASSGSNVAEVAKILDFGISKIQGAATRITDEVALLGTPGFMSPEQAEGRSPAAARSRGNRFRRCCAPSAIASRRRRARCARACPAPSTPSSASPWPRR